MGEFSIKKNYHKQMELKKISCRSQTYINNHCIIKNKNEKRVSIRFMRMGRRHRPFYRIIAVDSRKRRETEPLEFLGWYCPRTKETKLNSPSIKKWLNVGAQPSETLERLFKRAMILKTDT